MSIPLLPIGMVAPGAAIAAQPTFDALAAEASPQSAAAPPWKIPVPTGGYISAPSWLRSAGAAPVDMERIGTGILGLLLIAAGIGIFGAKVLIENKGAIEKTAAAAGGA